MASKSSDAGAAEVQKKVDKVEEKGYIGVAPDAHPNSAYSQESGPDSPGVGDVKVKE